MSKVTKINHVAIAVTDVEAALVFWRVWPQSYTAPMLSMAAAWLAVHCWEIGWLCSRHGEAQGG